MSQSDVPDPGSVVVAGDWGSLELQPARHVIRRAGCLLAAEPRRLILHTGDGVVWPGPEGAAFLAGVSRELEMADADLWFWEGNHDDHSRLEEIRRCHDSAQRELGRAPAPPYQVAPRVWWLPRGHRWRWHDRTWLAMGGGVSVDRARRTGGKDWWPAEEITAAQADAAVADGQADVLLCHDVPHGVTHTFPPPKPDWDWKDLIRAEEHRRRLQRVTDGVRPFWVIHGHLHMAYQRTCDFGYGPVEVTGLAVEGDPLSYLLLDVCHMTWTVDEQPG
jgi:hypothetical protein